MMTQSRKSTSRLLQTSLILCLMAVMVGCTSAPKQRTAPIKSEQEYFTRAEAAINAKNFFLAADQLQSLQTNYPYGRYAAQANLDLIYAYMKSGSFEKAKSSAAGFIQQHPDHPELDYALYMLALASFDVDRGFITRFLPTNPSERSTKAVLESYRNFKKLIQQFPESRYAQDARQRMVYLRNILAEHELDVGNYYLRRGAYVASINRAMEILQQYPFSPVVPQALALATKGHIELDMNAQAEQMEQLLAQQYPEYRELENGKLAYTRQSLREKRSWLNILSFGLIGRSGA